jgi:hypothetical protein
MLERFVFGRPGDGGLTIIAACSPPVVAVVLLILRMLCGKVAVGSRIAVLSGLLVAPATAILAVLYSAL